MVFKNYFKYFEFEFYYNPEESMKIVEGFKTFLGLIDPNRGEE